MLAAPTGARAGHVPALLPAIGDPERVGEQRCVWMEYLDELREMADVPRQGVVTVPQERMTDQPVGTLM